MPFYDAGAAINDPDGRKRDAIVAAIIAQSMGGGTGAGPEPQYEQALPADPDSYASVNADPASMGYAANMGMPGEGLGLNVDSNANPDAGSMSSIASAMGQMQGGYNASPANPGFSGLNSDVMGPGFGLTVDGPNGPAPGFGMGLGALNAPGQPTGYNVDAASNMSPGFTGFTNAPANNALGDQLGLNDIAGPTPAGYLSSNFGSPADDAAAQAASNNAANAAVAAALSSAKDASPASPSQQSGAPSQTGFGSPAAFSAADQAMSALNDAVASQMSDALAAADVAGPGPSGFGGISGGFGGDVGGAPDAGGDAGGPGVGGSSTGISGGPGGTGEGGANTGEGGVSDGGGGGGGGGAGK